MGTSPSVGVFSLGHLASLSVRRPAFYISSVAQDLSYRYVQRLQNIERSQFLHLFLYARGLISAGVRMNTLGPYAAQQVLLHAVRPIVTAETARCSHLHTGLLHPKQTPNLPNAQEIPIDDGPAMTWPLGEILAARHDLQHSRIFNS